MNEGVAIAERIGRLLLARSWKLAVAESCTGGLVGHIITEISGSSAFFQGGVISYANEVKRDLLSVPQEMLNEYGAVSHPTAQAMAQGVRRLLHVEVGVAITGVAGPTGGSVEKPVGTVYVAVSSPLGDQVQHHLWDADRSGNKVFSAQAALLLVEQHLSR